MRSGRLFTRIAILSFAFVHAGRGQQVARRDSAGVAIIEVPAGRLARLPMWRLDGPIVRIGEAMGDPAYEFHLAAWPWRLSDGRLVVANDQVELRIFDGSGRYLSTVGRRGRGPGEYQQLLALWRAPGDSLRVCDVVTGRVDVRGPDGALVRSITMPRHVTPVWLPGGGALYLAHTRLDLNKIGVRRDSALVRRILADGRAADTVAVLPGDWTDVLAGGNFRGVRLSGGVFLTGGADGAVLVHGEHLAVYWFAPEGKLAAITRVALPLASVTKADVRADEEEMGVLVARNRPMLLREGSVHPPVYAPYLPQATHVRLDAEGRAWVRRWTRWGLPTAEWIVFAPRGLPIARVTMPADFLANDIGRDYVLGIAVDDDGVQSVSEYRIRR
jgi:6-bladed beta-propeller